MSNTATTPSPTPAVPPGDGPPAEVKARGACWNIVGLFAFGLSIFLALGIFTSEMSGDSLGIGRTIYGGMAFFAGAALGCAASIAALVRGEQKKYLTWIGLILNGVPSWILLTGLLSS